MDRKIEGGRTLALRAPKRTILVWFALALTLLWPKIGAAQLAPTGPHYAGRASDTGHDSVGASGGYATSIPLDLPPARGGIPLPLQVVSGGHGFGAAGVGWDVPLSFVRVDVSYGHRRPANSPNAPIAPRKLVTVALPGQQAEMIEAGPNAWVGRNAPMLSMRMEDGMWKVFDGSGLTYTFSKTPCGALCPSVGALGLYLLVAIDSPGNSLALNYDIRLITLPNASTAALTIDLIGLSYNVHPSAACSKNQITLTYDDPPATDPPRGLSVMGTSAIVRKRKLVSIDVLSRGNSCSTSLERLRMYSLSYTDDPDTQQKRLASVTMFGRQGTPEASVALPIAEYTYGTATSVSPTNGARVLQYVNSQTLALPFGLEAKIASTETESIWPFGNTGGVTASASPQLLSDFTGDGRPDLVYEKNQQLWISPNVPSGIGETSLTSQSSSLLNDATYTASGTDGSLSTRNRFNSLLSDNTTDIWIQATDFNGDGRVDIINAREMPGRWVVYLNTPGSGPSGVRWVRREIDITGLYSELTSLGYALDSTRVPLSRRYTAHEFRSRSCYRYEHVDDDGEGYFWVSHPELINVAEGCYTGAAGDPNPPNVEWGEQATAIDWELRDLNGDGYPDLVYNSSPFALTMGDPYPEFQGFQPQLAWRDWLVRPEGNNDILARFNVAGVFLASGATGATDLFAAPNAIGGGDCGVGMWASERSDGESWSRTFESSTQILRCGYFDVNGDGLADRVESESSSTTSARLGTGSQMLGIRVTIPGNLLAQESGYLGYCDQGAQQFDPDNAWFQSHHKSALRDLTGDGVPDFIREKAPGAFEVYVGTGAGFASGIDIRGAFEISHEKENCSGAVSKTIGGLVDIDGDGKPETLVAAGTGNALNVWKLAGGDTLGAANGGLLTEVSNGYGAKTLITYRSAKEDATTQHQVPSPEIVVSAIETKGTMLLGGSLARTRYAYGNTSLYFDSTLDAYRATGYLRRVEQRTTNSVSGKEEQTSIITDRYGFDPFVGPTVSERYGRYLIVGRVKDLTVLVESVPLGDPWGLLTLDLTNAPGRIANTHYAYAGPQILRNVPVWTSDDCIEMSKSYDYDYSSAYNVYNSCLVSGLLYPRQTTSWRGTVGPPSDQNVQTSSTLLKIDQFGRVTSVLIENDVHDPGDDYCIDTTYAVPTGTDAKVLNAVLSRKKWGCGAKDIGSPTFAEESFEYDHLLGGVVSDGLVTSHTIYRHAADTGAWLDTIRDYDVEYNTSANPIEVTKEREDGARRVVTLEHDAFETTVTRTVVRGSNTPDLQFVYEVDPVSLDLVTSTDPNGTSTSATLDGFGRKVLRSIATLDGPRGVVETTHYFGFEPNTPPNERSVVVKAFMDPVEESEVDSEQGRVTTTYLDELGRARYSEVELGGDYDDPTLIVGKRTYDSLGRVSFEADPYPSSQNGSTAYGTTLYYDKFGSVALSIRGAGAQAYTTIPNASLERYPSLYEHSFTNHQEIMTSNEADSLVTGSAQAGVARQTAMTAVGHLLFRTTTQVGSKLEYATFAYDRLGNLSSMSRYQNPSSLTTVVTTSWQFDSLGQVLRLLDPSMPPQERTYSYWGELINVAQYPANEPSHEVVTSYDSLGRIVHSEERDDGQTVSETVKDFEYDVPNGSSPIIDPKHVLGRLAFTKTASSSVVFSYDGLGNVSARSYTDEYKDVYIEQHGFHADGSQAWIELNLPDNNYRPERVEYGYDTAGRPRWMWYDDGNNTEQLYSADKIDSWGRLRTATYGRDIVYDAGYAEIGRRLPQYSRVLTPGDERFIEHTAYDAAGRELQRSEMIPGFKGTQTSTYDSLGRLKTSKKADGLVTHSKWAFSYDPLGNITALDDQVGTEDATMSYLQATSADRDRLCEIGLGPTGLSGTCNVEYDTFGNISSAVTPKGQNDIEYYNSGAVRSISNQFGPLAAFRYDAFGQVEKLEIRDRDEPQRIDYNFGSLIRKRFQKGQNEETTYISRQFPGPNLTISRRGRDGEWVYQFAESRGVRFTANADGTFLQDLDYSPYGLTSSGGAQPGSPRFSTEQWNGGDALEGFGLSFLGARLYDPTTGRFLSRDPLMIPRTAATTNPYAFSFNDPVNFADPTGFDGDNPCKESLNCPNPAGLAAGLGILWSNVWKGGARPEWPDLPAADMNIFWTAYTTNVQAHYQAEAGQFFRERPGYTLADSDEALSGFQDWKQEKARQSWSWYKRGIYYGLKAPIVGNGFQAGANFADGNYKAAALHFTLAGVEIGMWAVGSWLGGRTASTVVEGGGRGLSKVGGVFTTESNAAGGRIVTSVGDITQAEVATEVNTAMYYGEVRVLSGAHGTLDGAMIPEPSFFADDVARFGQMPGVVVRDVTTMSQAEISAVLKSPGTTIGAFCNSGACLGPLK